MIKKEEEKRNADEKPTRLPRMPFFPFKKTINAITMSICVLCCSVIFRVYCFGMLGIAKMQKKKQKTKTQWMQRTQGKVGVRALPIPSSKLAE